jgi:hypothetical protein
LNALAFVGAAVLVALVLLLAWALLLNISRNLAATKCLS